VPGKPAARITDQTAHGGTIVEGDTTVLIGNKPAARVGDYHICPDRCPGGQRHDGGPILPPGGVTVLIGNRPAARIGDQAQCTCATDVIVTGQEDVLIG